MKTGISLCGLLLLALASAKNPLHGHNFYVNPSFQKELDTSIATATDALTKANLKKNAERWFSVLARYKGKSKW